MRIESEKEIDMNRRDFLTTMGGATAAAATLTHLSPALAAETTTAFYATGLVMVSFEDSRVLRLGLPKAPGHKATLAMLAHDGASRSVNMKGAYTVETAETASGRPDYKIPELIRMQEIYGNNVHSKVPECPTVISFPYAAITSITASEVSPTRYTFVRKDNGEEIQTFRPRKVAETLRIELSSDAVMKVDGKTIALNTMKKLQASYSPEDPESVAGMDAFSMHFPYYNAYLVRPPEADFDVVPKNLEPAGQSATPAVGHHFMPRIIPEFFCFVISC